MLQKPLPVLGFVLMRRVTAGFGLLIVLFTVLLVVVNVGQVWADTINPNPPMAGQPFTISGTATREDSAPCMLGQAVLLAAASRVCLTHRLGRSPIRFQDSQQAHTPSPMKVTHLVA